MHIKIKNFPDYDVYAEGIVKHRKSNHIKTKRIIRGYYYVDLHNGDIRKNIRLGRLVATHFIPNPLNFPQVNHKDGNCLNDDVNYRDWES